MTAKEYLMQYRNLDAKIDAEFEQLVRMRALAEKCTAALTGMPRGGGGDREDIYAKISDKGRELDAQIDQLLRLRDEIKGVIAAVPDDTHRTLLELRYLTRMTWEKIAESMDCDTVTAWRIHGHALQDLCVSNKIAMV